MSHSAWQSSLIMSGPDDGTSMKAEVNGKDGVASGSAENVKKEKKKQLDEPVLPPTASSVDVGGRMRGDG